MNYEETRYGFNYGSAVVERTASDHDKGWVVIGVYGVNPKTGRRTHAAQVYVTKTGRIRVTDEHGGELKVSK